MTLSIIDRPATEENLRAALQPTARADREFVLLAERRKGARAAVRLYRDRDGAPFIRDRWTGKRYISKIRHLTIDGKPLNCGAAVLQPLPTCVPLDIAMPIDPTGEHIDAGLLA